jgi:hypothetical protein
MYVIDAKSLEGLPEFHRIIAEGELLPVTYYDFYGRPQGIEILHRLGGIRRLSYGGPLTPELMQKIGSLPLQYLRLHADNFDDKTICHLAALQELKHLDLGTKTLSQMIPYIAKLTSLETLSLMMSAAPTASDVRQLRPLVNLRSLKLDGGYSPEMIDAIAEQFPMLEELVLWHLDDPAIVAPLAAHPSLKSIEIGEWEYEHTAPIEKPLPKIKVSHFYE